MNIASRVRRWGVAAAIAVVVGSLMLGSLYAQGFWDEATAVHIKSGTIESSTLAVGTHLIHLSALTDSIYEIANESAEESGQNRIYYKSELGEGAWFDITLANSLADITLEGNPITDEEIEALYFTHHTKSDKVTYDLRTGQPVNMFNIRNAYELETLEELSPLKLFYDQTIELEGENEITARIDEIWKTPLKGEQEKESGSLLDQISGFLQGAGSNPSSEEQQSSPVVEMEQQLSALQVYLNVLTENGADAREIDKVSGVMEAVDASRRYEVFLIVEEALNGYMQELGAGSSVEEPTAGEEGEGDSSSSEESTGTISADTPPELLSALSESIGNVEGALITYGGKMLSEGVTVVSSQEYLFSNDLIRHAGENNHAACDGDVQNLLILDNIQSGVISDRPRELALLEDRLLPEATGRYRSTLSSGENAQYRAAVEQQSAKALLNRFITENAAEINTRRGELEFLIDAASSRMDTAGAMDFIARRLELTTGQFTASIPQDDFAESAIESVEDHIVFLSDRKRELELALGGNELDQLIAQREDLQKKRMDALDNNDLEKAKQLQEQIESKEEEIRSLETETGAQIAALQDQIAALEDGSSEKAAAQAELANLQNSLSDGTLGAMVAQLKNDALAGDANAVNSLAGMLGTAPKLVLPALQEIYNDLLMNGGDQALLDAIEQAVLENPGALQDELSAETIRQIANGYLSEMGSGSEGAGLSGLLGAGGISRQDAQNAAAVILGLQMYYDETGNANAQKTMASMAQEQINMGNPLLYEAIRSSSGEYLPLTAIQTLTGRRYVWNKNASLGVLALGSDYYGFTVFSDLVYRDRDGKKTELMSGQAKYQNVVHIPEQYAYEVFGVQAVYLPGTTRGCACDDRIMELAQELFARLLSA